MRIKLIVYNENSILDNFIARRINGAILFFLFLFSFSNVGAITIPILSLCNLVVFVSVVVMFCAGIVNNSKWYKEYYKKINEEYILGYTIICMLVTTWLGICIIVFLYSPDIGYTKLITAIPIAILLFNLLNIPSLWEPVICTITKREQ